MKLLITIDVEQDCDTHWNRSDPPSFSSVTEGIPKLLRPIWNKYNIKPIYFVSPEVLHHSDSCRVLKEEISKGAIIGAHLHGEYIEPGARTAELAGKPSNEFPCLAYSTEVELAKIKNLTDLIEQKLGLRPEWYRAARFGADLDTMKSLKKLGYKYDSSVTPHIDWASHGGPDHRRAPEQPYWVLPVDLYTGTTQVDSLDLEEFPVTISGKRFGLFGRFLPDKWFLYHWLRPTIMFLGELRTLVCQVEKKFGKNATIVMMFHSMEIMVGKTPYVRNKWMQKRFLKTLTGILEFISNK